MRLLSAFRRRSVSNVLSAVLAAGTVVACADTTAPEPRRSGYITAAADVALPAQLSNTVIDFKLLYPKMATIKPAMKIVGDTVIQSFKIDPNKPILVEFGKATNYVHIPAQSVCDPKTSGYGPSTWMLPCTLASNGITVTVKSWTGANGRPYADFSPDLRFSPTALPPTLYFLDAQLTDFSSVIIPYCNGNGGCVNEGINDPLQTTYASPALTGGFWVFRALRHFSGYNVTAF